MLGYLHLILAKMSSSDVCLVIYQEVGLYYLAYIIYFWGTYMSPCSSWGNCGWGVKQFSQGLHCKWKSQTSNLGSLILELGLFYFLMFSWLFLNSHEFIYFKQFGLNIDCITHILKLFRARMSSLNKWWLYDPKWPSKCDRGELRTDSGIRDSH